jgi:hypothetical protein
MLRFCLDLGRTVHRRTKRRVGREIVIGLVAGAALATGAYCSPRWTFLVVALYLYTVQVVGMNDNDVFFDFGDFRRLGVTENNGLYKAAYIVQYVLRDLYVALALALALAVTAFLVLGHGGYALLTVLAFAYSLALLPSHAYLAFKVSARTKNTYLFALFLVFPALAACHVTGWSETWTLWPSAPLALGLVAAAHIACVDRWAGRAKKATAASRSSRHLFSGLAPRRPFLFKDLLLFHRMAATTVFMGLALFALLACDAPRGFVAPLALMAVCHDNMFLSRRQKSYQVLADDNLFREQALPRDLGYLRRRKLGTLLLDVPVKLAVCCAAIALAGAWEPAHLPLLALIIAVNFVIDAPLLFIDLMAARIVRATVKYLLVTAFLLHTYAGAHPAGVVVLAGLLVLLYGPGLGRVYRRRRLAPAPRPAARPAARDLAAASPARG